MAPRAKSRMRQTLARVAAGAALCVVAGALSGCQGIAANTADSAEVRFVDTSKDAPAVDFYVNSTGAAYNLGYGTFSSYVSVAPGTSLISANRANTAQALVNAHAALTGAHQYTAVISSHLGSLQENVYPDLIPATVPGMISVRVLNEAEAGPLDIYLIPGSATLPTASPFVSSLNYTAASAYERLGANTTYTVAAVPAGVPPSTSNAVTVSGVTLSGGPGAVRTVVLSDVAKPESKGVYGFVLDDAETP